MKSVIIDASVALKWFFDEELKEVAEDIFDQIETRKIKAIVPEIFYFEMSNICSMKSRRKLAEPALVMTYFSKILDIGLERHLHETIADVALEYSLQMEVSVYDASYLALAEIYGAPLVTADKKLVRACQGKFELIEYLGDFK